jgi:hypothetical protein
LWWMGHCQIMACVRFKMKLPQQYLVQ